MKNLWFLCLFSSAINASALQVLVKGGDDSMDELDRETFLRDAQNDPVFNPMKKRVKPTKESIVKFVDELTLLVIGQPAPLVAGSCIHQYRNIRNAQSGDDQESLPVIIPGPQLAKYRYCRNA